MNECANHYLAEAGLRDHCASKRPGPDTCSLQVAGGEEGSERTGQAQLLVDVAERAAGRFQSLTNRRMGAGG